MTEPAVVEEQLILVDGEGRPTDDKAAAVRGEVVQTMDDGTTRHTLFDIDRPTDR